MARLSPFKSTRLFLALVAVFGVATLMFGAVLAATPDTELAKIVSSDIKPGDQFGHSTAMSGDTIVVGAPGKTNPFYGYFGFGAAYVFVRDGGGWVEQAKLIADDAITLGGGFFGYSVAISGDTIVLGAMRDDDSGHDAGAAYVFVRSGTTWSQQAKLKASDGDADDEFGISVAVDGETIVVGAHEDDDAGSDSGSAYVFVRTGTTWSEQVKLVASDASSPSHFGIAVAVSGDTALIGAKFDAAFFGSSYVFVRSGTMWSEQSKLLASDGASGDEFGNAVALSGETALIGAPGHAEVALDSGIEESDTGGAYVFVRSGTSWSEQAELLPTDTDGFDEFGASADIDGDTAIIGSRRDDNAGPNSGSAYIFVRSGAAWSQETKLVASDAASADEFGKSVSVNGDTAVVGSWLDDDGGLNSGSAYIFGPAAADADGDGVLDDIDMFPNSNLDATVSIDGCDTGADNHLFDNGATFNDLIGAAALNANNHGSFVKQVTQMANQWKKDGLISGKEKGKITTCASRSDLP